MSGPLTRAPTVVTSKNMHDPTASTQIPCFGLRLVDRLITPLGVNRVSCAVGVWPGALERAMVRHDPSPQLLENLAAISKLTWVLGIEVSPPTVEEMQGWLRDFESAPVRQRLHLESSVLQPEVYVMEATERFPPRATAKTLWLRRGHAFSFRAYLDTFGIPYKNKADAEMDLHAMRFLSQRQWYEGRIRKIWRWNPLKVDRPQGRPIQSPLTSSNAGH